MKDIKNIIILVLLIATLVFGYVWFFGQGKNYRDQIKQLEKTRLELIQERTTLDESVKTLEEKNKTLVSQNEKLNLLVKEKDFEIKVAKEKAAKSVIQLNEIKAGIKDTQARINEIEKNPIKRTGDELLNSLKSKTQPK